MSNDFSTIDEKDEAHQMTMEIEPLLIASGYRTWGNILQTQGKNLVKAWRRSLGSQESNPSFILGCWRVLIHVLA